MQDGLSSNIVSAIAQDSLGFMWFGTSAGLDRFDGRHFDHFRSDQDDPNSIISNVVRDVFVDNEGSLWVAYDNGISKYLFEENRFLNFYTNSENLKIPYAIIRFHQLDSAHLILDQTGKGLFHIFNTQKNRVEISFDAKEYLTSTTSDVYLKLLTIDKRNGIWITLNDKLIRIEYDNNSFIFQDITSLIPPEASTDGSFDISECQDSDKFIISSGNHVGLYDFNDNHKIQLLYAKNYDFNISSYEGTKSAKGFMDNTEKQPSTFDIYPNPATDYFTILTDTENSSVQIFNMNGQIMFNETVSNNLLRVNCEHYKTGVYLVVVINENGKMYKRKLIVY